MSVVVIFLVWLVVVLFVTNATLIPNEPLAFGQGRASAGNATVLYTFRQSECVSSSGSFSEAVSGGSPGLSLVRVPRSASTCPVALAGSVPFQAVVPGIVLSPGPSSNTLMSNGTFGTQSASTTSFTETLANSPAISVEIWFSVTSLPTTSTNAVLLEVSPPTASPTVPFQLSFNRNNGNQLTLTFEYGAGQVFSGTLDGSGSSGAQRLLNSLGSSTSAVYMLIFTIQSSYDTYLGSNITDWSIYFAQYNAPATYPYAGVQYILVPTIATDSVARTFAFPATSALRVGSTASSTYTGWDGTIYLVGWYDRALSASNVSALFVGGLPHALPVTGPFFVQQVWQDQYTTLHLVHVNETYYDAQMLLPTAIQIQTPLPTTGTLFTYAGGEKALSASEPLSLLIETSTEQLQFRQTTPYLFSVATNTTTCPSSSTFANVSFSFYDGLCDNSHLELGSSVNCISPQPGTVGVCVVDVQNLPEIPPNRPQELSAGQPVLLTFNATDPDDYLQGLSDGQPSTFRLHELDGSISPRSSIEFVSIVLFPGDVLEFVSSDDLTTTTGPCNGTSVPADTRLFRANTTKQFTFCYVPSVWNISSSASRTATLTYVVYDRVGGRSVNNGTLILSATNPLQSCPSTGYIPTSLLQPPASSCVTEGLENNPYTAALGMNRVPVYLQGSAGNTTALGLQFRVLQFPTHGSLYINQGSDGTLVLGPVVNASFPIVVHTTSMPNLVYVGDENYFNRVAEKTGYLYTNLLGQGVDGCLASMPGVGCRCNTTSAPGCPDLFSYVTEFVSSTSNLSSVVGTYTIYVNSYVSAFPSTSLSFPTAFEAVDATTAKSPVARYYVQGESFSWDGTILPLDWDDNVYYVTLFANASIGSWTLEEEEGGTAEASAAAALTFVLCNETAIEGCVRQFAFWTTVFNTNIQFPLLHYQSNALVGNRTNRIAVTVMKALPSGTTNENAASSYLLTASNAAIVSTEFELVGLPAPVPPVFPWIDLVAPGLASVLAAAGVFFCRRLVVIHHRIQQEQHATTTLNSSRRRRRLRCRCCVRRKHHHHHQHSSTTSRNSTASRPHSQLSSSVGDRVGSERNSVPRQHPTPAVVVVGTPYHLPEDSVFAWEKHLDKKSGNVYFFNTITGVSQWDPPFINHSGK